MGHRIIRTVSALFMSAFFICAAVRAGQTESVTVVIPVTFSESSSYGSDAVVTVSDISCGRTAVSMTRSELDGIGGRYVFSEVFDAPGEHSYSFVCSSPLGTQQFLADVCVTTDDTGVLSASVIVTDSAAGAKREGVVFDLVSPGTAPSVRPGGFTPVLGAVSSGWVPALLMMALAVALAVFVLVSGRHGRTRTGEGSVKRGDGR